MTETPRIARYEIVDPLGMQDRGAIEVVLWLADGSKRWCSFTASASLVHFGDWIDGTRIPFHHSTPHMIIVGAPLNEALIDSALKTLEREECLLTSTRAVDD